MSQVEFQYNGGNTTIQCNESDKMSDIIKKFASKAQINIDLLYFSYDGKEGRLFNQELSFKQTINLNDRAKNKMVILVKKIDEGPNSNNSIIKSKDIICPRCFENSTLKINNYRIALYDLKNEHKIDNITLNEFEASQKIDMSKIICGDCKNSYEKEFFKCLECNIYLCNKCKEAHNEHDIIDYDYIRYTCQNHNDNFSAYCKDCKLNICMYCKKEHKNHDLIEFGDINNNTNKKELQKKLKELKTLIEKFKEINKTIINILNEVEITFELYYKIKEDIINNYNNKKKNYELFMNLNEIENSDDIINDINQTINQKNILNKFNSILNIHNKLKIKDNEKKWTLVNEKEELNKKIQNLEEKCKNLEKSQSTTKLNNNDNSEEMKNKLELIGKVIKLGNDPKSQVCTKYNLGNKFLVIELIHTDFIKSEKVAEVMLEVDRNNFAPRNPYTNKPQYIGYNVTISAPHMHAFALEHLSKFCTKGAHILDVGSGSGFLTVALSKMTNDTGTIIGVEHIPELYDFGIKNVKKKHSDLIDKKKIIFVEGDGRLGCKEYAPYKAIHVGAASEKVPQALIDQLDYNGRIFIPVGKRGETQHIYLIDKDSKGEITSESILSVCYGMLTDVDSQLNQD